MSFFGNLKNKFVGKALEQCADPFEEGRVIVLLNFSLFMFISNTPYLIMTFKIAEPFHFISALVQNLTLITVMILLNRGYKVHLARNLFFANFFLQNLYHYVINNGVGTALEQGVLFFTLITLFAFLLYGNRFGWFMFTFIACLLLIGIYNKQTNNSIFNVPANLADPTMNTDMRYIVILPIAMNVYLVSQFVRAQRKAKETISHQNKELAEKNKEVTDSINYAKRIQEAILPSQTIFDETLKEVFVLYMPKDIVAGDFYFLENQDQKIFLAAADCTGHGVPGAMMSVVCANSLKRSVKEFNLKHSGAILDKTREIVIENLSGSEREINDGMDISFCVLDTKLNSVQWSGANNPLWIIRYDDLLEFKADKQPVGRHHKLKPFSTHDINLQKGDTLYLFTDGYQDQFGGEKEKKYTAKRLKQKLKEIQKHTMREQKDILQREFEKWRGQYDQIDDVCIIGIRIS